MSFEPEKFFVGIIDFFSILLPGAVLTYLFKNAVGPQLLGLEYTHLQNNEGWALFLFSSYVLGHFLFFVGSWLDDFAYDPLRKMTDKEQITRLLAGRRLSPRILRRLAKQDDRWRKHKWLPLEEAQTTVTNLVVLRPLGLHSNVKN